MAQSTSSTGNQPLIELRHVDKHYGDLHVLNDINLSVDRGEVVVVIGPSGSGKSTMCRTINRLETIDSGEILIEGEPLPQEGKDLARMRAELGMVFQQFNLFAHMTVLQNVMLGPVDVLGVSKEEARERAMDLLSRVGVAEQADKVPAQLSGGQQQRVAIARALVNNPKVLLLDEPLGALDYQLRKNLQLELKNLQRGLGLTFIYVTHDQEEALTMSDRIVVMNKGVIEQDDNPDTIYHYPNTRFVAKFIGESNFFETESETLVIRPEKLNLCPEYEDEQAEKQHPEPGYYGTVVDVVFYGTIDKVFIRLDNSNQTVVAYQYFDDVKRWSPDERVGIWWYKKDEVKVSR